MSSGQPPSVGGSRTPVRSISPQAQQTADDTSIRSDLSELRAAYLAAQSTTASQTDGPGPRSESHSPSISPSPQRTERERERPSLIPVGYQIYGSDVSESGKYRGSTVSVTPPLPGFSEPSTPALPVRGTPRSPSLMYGGSTLTTPGRSHAKPPPPPSPLMFHLAPPPAEGEEPHRADGKTVDPETLKNSKIVLGVLVVLKLLTSYDGGAFSVILGAEDGLQQELGLSPSEAGTLSSSVFLGNLAGCVVAGNMFSKYSAKHVMLLGMLAHALFTFLFGFSYNFEYAVACRFFIGITLAFPVVYSPVWVEAFGPQDRATTWMALCNAGVPIGIMLGFVIGGLVPAHTDLDWRWIFFSKAIFMIPILFGLQRLDSKHIDTEGSTKHGEAGESIGQAVIRLVTILVKFCRNALYFNNVAALCCLYFVITALQTFITPYLREPPFNASMNTIVVGFGGTVVTAPVVGVIGGGVLIDRMGGYHENVAQAMNVQALWGFGAFVFAIITLMTTNVLGFLVSMWCLLCLGGAIVPVATGVLVASVEEEHRSAASSVSAMCFNLFGYFSGPLFCGMVTDVTGSLAWGIRITLLCSGFGCIPMGYAAYAARRQKLSTHSCTNSQAPTDEIELRSGSVPTIVGGGPTPPPLDPGASFDAPSSSTRHPTSQVLAQHHHLHHPAEQQVVNDSLAASNNSVHRPDVSPTAAGAGGPPPRTQVLTPTPQSSGYPSNLASPTHLAAPKHDV